jgi:Na+(H+)/acetate symporter ActP
MQFGILFIGAMLFVFYQFTAPPLYFNPVETAKVKQSTYSAEYQKLEDRYKDLFSSKKMQLDNLVSAMDGNAAEVNTDKIEAELESTRSAIKGVRESAVDLIKKADPASDGNDTNYIFLSFVLSFLPAGIVGLVLAAVLAASMSSTSSEINSLASTTIIDIYKRMIKKEASDNHYLIVSKMATVFWGLFAIAFAEFASNLGSLIEAVNILGSLFYGTILGIFLLAFYFKKAKGTATFYAALIAEVGVMYCYFFTNISFLWYNVVGCLLVIVISLVLSYFMDHKKNALTA